MSEINCECFLLPMDLVFPILPLFANTGRSHEDINSARLKRQLSSTETSRPGLVDQYQKKIHRVELLVSTTHVLLKIRVYVNKY